MAHEFQSVNSIVNAHTITHRSKILLYYESLYIDCDIVPFEYPTVEFMNLSIFSVTDDVKLNQPDCSG